MTRTHSSPVPFLLALVAMAALGWFMSTQTGTLPSHLQAQATPGPLKHPTAVAFTRHPNMTLTLAQLTPAQ